MLSSLKEARRIAIELRDPAAPRMRTLDDPCFVVAVVAAFPVLCAACAWFSPRIRAAGLLATHHLVVGAGHLYVLLGAVAQYCMSDSSSLAEVPPGPLAEPWRWLPMLLAVLGLCELVGTCLSLLSDEVGCSTPLLTFQSLTDFVLWWSLWLYPPPAAWLLWIVIIRCAEKLTLHARYLSHSDWLPSPLVRFLSDASAAAVAGLALTSATKLPGSATDPSLRSAVYLMQMTVVHAVLSIALSIVDAAQRFSSGQPRPK